MSDLFHEAIPDEWIQQIYEVMATASQHTFQILTKRARRMAQWWKRPVPNIWLGVSVEDQARADERIPWLLQTPAAVRFLSVEPLLGPVDLTRYFMKFDVTDPSPHPDWAWEAKITRGLHWVIVGGESGGPSERALVWRTCFCGDFERDHRGGTEPMSGLCFCGCRRWRPSGPFQPDGEREGWVRSLRDQCVAAGVPFFFKQWGGPTPKSGGRLLDGREWNEYPMAANRL